MDAPTLTTERQQMRQVLADLAAKAKQTLPAESAGRIDRAVRLVLAGDVEMQADGTAQVASMTNPLTTYTVNGSCPCQDFARAPAEWCSHRIARALVIRLGRVLPAQPRGDITLTDTVPAPPQMHSEAPASCNVYVTISGHKVQVTLRDHDEQRMLDRLQVLLDRYPAPAKATEPGDGWCSRHNVHMQQNNKQGRVWWSHRHEGQWCKGGAR